MTRRGSMPPDKAPHCPPSIKLASAVLAVVAVLAVLAGLLATAASSFGSTEIPMTPALVGIATAACVIVSAASLRRRGPAWLVIVPAAAPVAVLFVTAPGSSDAAGAFGPLLLGWIVLASACLTPSWRRWRQRRSTEETSGPAG